MTTRGADSNAPIIAAQASLGFLLSSLGACLILLARDLGAPRGDLTWLSAGFGAALILVGALGPWLLGAGAAVVLRASAATLAAGAALLAAAPSLLSIQAGALLFGLGGAGIVLASPALLAGPRAAARLARATAAGMIAGVCAPLSISVADALAGNGRLALLLPLPALVWLAARRTTCPATPAAEPVQPPPIASHIAATWSALVLAVAAEFAFVIWGAARLQDSGLSAPVAAAAAAAFPLGMAAGRLAAPWFIATTPVVALGAALGIGGALAMSAPAGPLAATAALGLAGFGIAPLYPVIVARLLHIPRLGLRRAAGLCAAASGTAALAAPAALHSLAAGTSLRASFVAVAALLALVLALDRARIRETRPARTARSSRRSRAPG
jgi:hypothetical protein